MAKKVSKFQQICAGARALLDENQLHSEPTPPRWRRFVHFWVLVWRSFVRNRCPVRASALAYGTLLALIPMLAVMMSITSGLLKKQGEVGIEKFIEKLIAGVTSTATLDTNPPHPTGARHANLAPAVATAISTNFTLDDFATEATDSGRRIADARDRSAETPVSPREESITTTQKSVARNINQFIQNTQSGALGVTGSVLLIFAAISMLSRIEATFNDIWGVPRGRSWFMRIVLYWGVLSLAPLLLVVALGLATGPHLEFTKHWLATLPFVGHSTIHLAFQFLPVVVLCLTFAAFYMLMPNANVHWRAALVGGLVGGLLFHLNNAVSVLYVSRVVSNSKIYGSLGLVPVFMIGLYLSWLILLFGAQVSYAYQNRTTYLEEKQVETINQRGREFVALRLMTLVGQRYLLGEPPCSVTDMSEELGVPTRLVRQVMRTLVGAHLAVETAGAETAFLPARPMENITCHDLLLAMRAGKGQELATRDEPTRIEVYGEYHRIQEAEREAASSVNLLALVSRAQARKQLT